MARRRRKNDGAGLGFLILLVGGAAVLSWLADFWTANRDAIIAVATVGGGLVLLLFCGRIALRRAEQRQDRLESARQQEQLRIEQQGREQRRLLAYQDRREQLRIRFGDEQVAAAILAGDIWHDMTREQLIESWGQPAAVDTKVMKTKVRETLKYDQTGKNRFARKAVLENGVVVGWEN